MRSRTENHSALLFLVCLTLTTSSVRGQVLLKDAPLSPPGSWILMSSFSIASISKTYDWTENAWASSDGQKAGTFAELHVTAGRSLSDRMELLISIPWLAHRDGNQGGLKTGLGDIVLISRLGILKRTESKHSLTGLMALRSPAANPAIDPFFGDGTWDIGAGLLWASPPRKTFRFHVKSSYWFNNVIGSGMDPADDFIFIVKQETAIVPKLKLYIRYRFSRMGYSPAAGEQYVLPVFRHSLTAGIVWKLWSAVTLRPAVRIPLGGKGGNLLSVNPDIDFRYIIRRRNRPAEKDTEKPDE
ncbi:MAG TPA: hypothetical protein ENN03_10410 [bacterium]|nr:hypothetical protein [bacterium]